MNWYDLLLFDYSKILLQYFTNQLFHLSIMLLKYLTNVKVKAI